MQVVIPAGVGIRYKLDRHWDLSFEIGWRKTFTDYLDDVSGSYADKDKLKAAGGQEAAILSDRSFQSPYAIEAGLVSVDPATGYGHANGFGLDGDQRGDKSDKDWYIVTGFHLNYILNPNVRSPKFR